MATPQVLSSGPVDAIFSVIAEEAGVSRSELSSADDFAELGIDDLLARSIVSHITATLKLDFLPTIFKDYPTVEELQKYLHKTTSPPAAPSKSLPPKSTKPTTPPAPSPRKHPVKPTPKAPSTPTPLSILLQNTPATTARTLFLLPDGSGSGMAYARIPALSPNVCLIGMNSPFLTTPTPSTSAPGTPAFTLTIEALAPLWIAEIRARQPHGPYLLGGWSAGGYYSFEVAKQLLREGEAVSTLVLIDSPCRLEFEPLPPAVIAYLAAENLLGSWGARQPPAWFVEHFAGTIEAVGRYMPTPMTALRERMPRVHVIWSTDGVLEDVEAARGRLDLGVKVTRFLLEARTDFGLHGWERLLPGAEVLVAKMPGNHFTMVHPPHATELGNLLRDVVQTDEGKRKSSWEVVKA
ncbi:hypothetical protein MMC11_007103 [Xylographa trunciseda]|nr:hypothetical protein [Xylographa trunciseda]